ncbi:MAG: carbon-nitrogen hydrolase [Candidatus Tectomicrobia bacterium]|uniref:Carbon-nitrogen hydrolase n=1 Tax=Tectimicrobiota bacterium TaxID=2528274 RepID=A0A932HYR9_UNCTE|nr:carbon-nitrogen hydrolase [Candidatus Tectomicrobia bacterium]
MKFLAALAQIGPTLGNLEANFAMFEASVRSARRKGAELLVFPELSLTGYFLKDMVPDVAERPGGELLKRVAALSEEVALVVGFVEESARHAFYNAAAYFEGGKLVHLHRKIYLPTYGLFDEHRYVGAGSQMRAFETRFGRAAILVCEDAWHPSLAYVAALDGADLLFVPSASPARGPHRRKGAGPAPGKGATLSIQRTWQSLTRAYATAFNQYVFFANRVGYEDGIHFWGGSEVIAPSGEAAASAPLGKPHLLLAGVDTAEVRRSRVASPTLRDENPILVLRELRRIEARKE